MKLHGKKRTRRKQHQKKKKNEWVKNHKFESWDFSIGEYTGDDKCHLCRPLTKCCTRARPKLFLTKSQSHSHRRMKAQYVITQAHI